MPEVLIVLAILAALVLFWDRRGKWRQRARGAESQNETDRKANETKNRVINDPSFRERVRRRFDRP